MNKQKLQTILLDQKEQFRNKRNLVERDVDLAKYIQTQQIVVISGVRRSGKSSLLFLLKQSMQLQDADYCYFNFDDERINPNVDLLNDIYALHIELFSKEPVLFFDEIQVVKGWEKFVNRMYESGHKVFITGSNATLLSSEIATTLTGRNKVLELYPFSFAEYLRYINHFYDVGRLTTKQRALVIGDLNTYLQEGGFPLAVKEKDPEIIDAWFRDIMYRDVVSRYRIEQVTELKEMVLFLLSNIGKIFSYSTLQKIATVGSLNTIKNYLLYCERSYLFFYLKKFNFSLRKQMLNSRKVYTIDTAVANRLGMNFSDNKGRMLENVVFIELLRRQSEVYYHTGKNECDFVVKNKNRLQEAIQVCYELNDENVTREITGLSEAMCAFGIPEGLLLFINNNVQNISLPNKIKMIPVYQWLLERS